MPTIFQMVDADDVCVGYQFIPDPPTDFVGPAQEPAPPEGPYSYYRVDERLPLTGSSPTEVLMWNGGNRVLVEREPLAAVAARAIEAIDAEGDAARLRVSPPGRDLEYQLAEAQARPYAAAGYPDPVPRCVASWAAAKRWTSVDGQPWTGRQAADDIIATAERWYAAIEDIRDLRLNAKERIRAVVAAAGAPAEVEAIAAQFSADLSNLMKGLA